MEKYVIKKGDNLWTIAKNNKIDLDTLLDDNNLTAKSLIVPGQQIILKKDPILKEYDYDETQTKLKDINNLPNNEAKIMAYQTQFRPDEKYILEDKTTGKMFVYKGNTKISEYKVGHGKANTDYLTVTKTDNKGRLLDNEGNMSTPAGVFKISGRGNYHNLPSYTRQIPDKVDKKGDPYNIPSSIHFSKTIKKESNGCSRLDTKCLEDLAKQNIRKGTTNYILPENKETGEFYATSQGMAFRSNLPVNKLQGYSPKTLSKINVTEVEGKSDYSKKFLKALVDNKENLAKDLNLTNDEYDKLVKTSYGLLAQESNYGDNSGIRGMLGQAVDSAKIKTNTGNPSVGGTQIKITNLPAAIREKYKLSKQSIHESAESSAIATISKLAHSYKNEMPASKKKNAEDIDLGLRILHQYGQKGTNQSDTDDFLDSLDVFNWYDSDNEKNKKRGSIFNRFLNNDYSAKDDGYYQKMKKAQENLKIKMSLKKGGVINNILPKLTVIAIDTINNK